MIHLVLLAFWLLLPAGAANMTPVIAAAIKPLRRLDAPIDCGLTFRGKPILGPHKTWRGLFSGMLIATIVLMAEHTAVGRFGWAAKIVAGTKFMSMPTFIVGPLLGLGALGADSIESFFKRQRGTKSGESWLLFDQLDYIIGGIIVIRFFINLSLLEYGIILIVWFALHLAASYVGWRTGFKEKPI